MAVQRTLQSPASTPGKPIIVVTGAGGALGSALCWHLLPHYRVVAVGRGEHLAELRSNEQVKVLDFELTQLSAWEAALSEVGQHWGAVRGAVLCAGGWEGGKAVYETEQETWQRMFESNLTTAQVSLRALLPQMKQQQHGSVVVIGSRAVERPWESSNAAAYGASKAALVSLIKTAAQELLGQGVRINAVMPSTLDTAANRNNMPQANFSRWVSLPELNAVIEFLLSDPASGVTGAAIPVYGRL